MSRIVAQFLVALSVILSVSNAQCLTVCSFQSCAGKAPVPLDLSDTSSCHHKRAPNSPPQKGHGEHGESCAHQLLRDSSSEAAKAPVQVVTPASSLQPLQASLFAGNSVLAQPPT